MGNIHLTNPSRFLLCHSWHQHNVEISESLYTLKSSSPLGKNISRLCKEDWSMIKCPNCGVRKRIWVACVQEERKKHDNKRYRLRMGTENNTSVLLISFEIFCRFLIRLLSAVRVADVILITFPFNKKENLNRPCMFLSAFRFPI